ncbi:unnamed protein product, partial [Prunus brigantina]
MRRNLFKSCPSPPSSAQFSTPSLRTPDLFLIREVQTCTSRRTSRAPFGILGSGPPNFSSHHPYYSSPP